ncbi:MAG TPA: alpha/beta hydrolase [Paraburkholderia sp.]|jgi:arylformamidase|nr:alpha/beta hydrolase [Paraburkholderia sp.]
MNSLYRGMDRAALDAAYNNVRAEPDYPAIMARFKEQSEAIYRSVEVKRDIRYGAGARQRFDWLSCGKAAAPTFVFIHGGYWQNYAKDDLAFIARGPLERGFNVVLAEYTLAPDASMTQIVGEIGALLEHLQADTGETGFGGRPVCVCGHSAGGQLAALYRHHPGVTLTVCVSALFDLEPISLSWLNEKLQLTEPEISRFSPLHRIDRGAPTIVSVGMAELPELIRQSQRYAAACEAAGESTTFVGLPERRHFTILADVADPGGVHMQAIVDRVICPSR